MPNNQKFNYAFIDGQNLYRGTKKLGWELDYKKLRIYLQEKYHVRKAFMFVGYIKTNESLYEFLRKTGYQLIFKPITITKEGKVKGNVDVDLTVHTLINIVDYNRAIIISGDGDFYALLQHLISRNKLQNIMLPNKNECSWMLKRFRKYFVEMNDLQSKLKYKKSASEF
ncbi:MAG: NYN domain-containing protein [Candidatus Peregrinibacteria bacterium]|nr:NYN domain-containing protein [Candidatus Peregrinibacteria bacterium]MDZ4244422.1 NYN domain-containing protein [Candidatus Gracilibacteria bacterium]